MKEWLLKDEKKKVGRPKLASDDVLKKAKISMAVSLVICFVLMFSFFSILKGTSPTKLAYSLTFEKMFGMLENKNGFLVNDFYDSNDNYVMEFKVPDVVYNYSGSYKYTLYELSNNEWKKTESKSFDNETKSFKVKIKSVKNQNKTWKIKLQITNASNIKKSYAPASWYFNDAEKSKDMYAYKVFTVKGYYSPVTNEEIKLANKNQDKITIETKKGDPRTFILNLPNGNYNVIVKYTDASSKEVLLANDKNVTGTLKYSVPGLNRSTKVSFKIYGSNVNELKLSNWKYVENSKKGNYITNTYILKPENTYKN